VCGRNVEVDSRICNQSIRGHRLRFAKRRMTSRGDRARVGSRR
jgi:hypothetical protein